MRLGAKGEGSAMVAGRDSPTDILKQLSGNSRLSWIWKKKLSSNKGKGLATGLVGRYLLWLVLGLLLL